MNGSAGAFPNPVYYGAVPGGAYNPTGTQTAFADPFGGTGAGTNPMLPNVPTGTSTVRTGSLVPGGAMPANAGPYGATAATTAGQQFGGLSGPMSAKESKNFQSILNKAFGKGMGDMMFHFIQSGAGFNPQMLNNLLAAMQPGIERGEEDVMEQFSATGNRFGSPAGVGLGDYLSRVQLNQGQIIEQFYNDALDRFMQTLMGTSGVVAGRKATHGGALTGFVRGLSDILGSISPGHSSGGGGGGGGGI